VLRADLVRHRILDVLNGWLKEEGLEQRRRCWVKI